MAGIYIHIPFCKSKCYYCDFYSCTLLAKKEGVLDAILHELHSRAYLLQDETVRTLYVGGGTPSLLEPGQIGRLIGCVRETFRTALEETTVEANPDDLTPAYLGALRDEGVDRLSIGIQSFSDRDLRWMHRRHDAGAAVRAVRDAQAAGLRNLTIDLIYGLPHMTLGQWNENLEQALALGVQHISAYHLSIEPRTVLGRRAARGALSEIDEKQSGAQYELLHEKLTAAGYLHYEISNFARPGYEARHNSGYWNGERYLGVGPSAHSFDGRVRQWNVADVNEYLKRVPAGIQYDIETIDERTEYNEFIMTRLRTSKGVRSDEILDRFGARKLQYFVGGAEKFIAQGNIIRENSVYYIPAQRYLISDGIIADLFDVE